MISPLTLPPPPKPLNEFPYRGRDQIAIRFTEVMLRNPSLVHMSAESLANEAYKTVKALEKASNAS